MLARLKFREAVSMSNRLIRIKSERAEKISKTLKNDRTGLAFLGPDTRHFSLNILDTNRLNSIFLYLDGIHKHEASLKCLLETRLSRLMISGNQLKYPNIEQIEKTVKNNGDFSDMINAASNNYISVIAHVNNASLVHSMRCWDELKILCDIPQHGCILTDESVNLGIMLRNEQPKFITKFETSPLGNISTFFVRCEK